MKNSETRTCIHTHLTHTIYVCTRAYIHTYIPFCVFLTSEAWDAMYMAAAAIDRYTLLMRRDGGADSERKKRERET